MATRSETRDDRHVSTELVDAHGPNAVSENTQQRHADGTIKQPREKSTEAMQEQMLVSRVVDAGELGAARQATAMRTKNKTDERAGRAKNPPHKKASVPTYSHPYLYSNVSS